MKLRIWCDSGANAHSKREEVCSIEDLGVSEGEWAAMAEELKEALVKEIAFAQLDWGFQEV